MTRIKTWKERVASDEQYWGVSPSGRDHAKDEEIAELRAKLAELEGYGWKHVANEWADMATNGIQYMRNVKEGITTFDKALEGLAGNLEHCLEVAAGAGAREAQPMTEAEPIAGYEIAVDMLTPQCAWLAAVRWAEAHYGIKGARE